MWQHLFGFPEWLSIGHAGHVQHIQHRTCSCFSSFSFFNPESVSFGCLGQSASLDGGNRVCCLGALFTIPPLSIKSNRKSCQAFMMTTLIYWTCTNIAYYYPTPLEMSKYNTATSKHRVQIYSVIVQYKTVFLTGLVKLWHTTRHNNFWMIIVSSVEGTWLTGCFYNQSKYSTTLVRHHISRRASCQLSFCSDMFTKSLLEQLDNK